MKNPPMKPLDDLSRALDLIEQLQAKIKEAEDGH